MIDGGGNIEAPLLKIIQGMELTVHGLEFVVQAITELSIRGLAVVVFPDRYLGFELNRIKVSC